MITPHDRIIRYVFVSCIFVGLLANGWLSPASAQVLPPINDPPPGSTLTLNTVTFTGGHANQSGEQHWLSVGTAPWNHSIFHQSLGTGHTATVSGLFPKGTLYVRYHTYTPVAGWDSQLHTYRMDVGRDEPRVQSCSAGDIDCLINAITIANGSGNPEVIKLAAGTYNLVSINTNNLDVSSGFPFFPNFGSSLFPSIIGDVTIIGEGPDATVIQASNLDPQPGHQTFDVDQGGMLHLTGLSLRHGQIGIYNRGMVTLDEVVISDNQGTGLTNHTTGTATIKNSSMTNQMGFPGAPGLGGHGIENAGTMKITGSMIAGNLADRDGGIVNVGKLTIEKSTITNNEGRNFEGGGITNRQEGLMEILNCLVQSNTAANGGGGIYNLGNMTIARSVITGNTTGTGGSGGGIRNIGFLAIEKTVIANNTASDSGGGILNTNELTLTHTVIVGNEAFQGGGISHSPNASITLSETIVTNNSPNDCPSCQ